MIKIQFSSSWYEKHSRRICSLIFARLEGEGGRQSERGGDACRKILIKAKIKTNMGVAHAPFDSQQKPTSCSEDISRKGFKADRSTSPTQQNDVFYYFFSCIPAERCLDG